MKKGDNMLKLAKITKDYLAGNNVVHALKGIDITFRKSEFVSVLGASGCGKTTMLNIIGGLDKYTNGDLIINGVSTKQYTDRDWDAYRNEKIGFIFQTYNLIMHMSVLANVEIALTLSGVNSKERKERAKKVLEEVGLAEQIHKKPNQLSGGQMQRVAIARALVNNPEIILADEPTGALDSQTSIQIMDILQKISKDKLIIMVTHNPDIAKLYSTRIIQLKDGEMVSDSDTYEEKIANHIEEVAEDINIGKRKKRVKKPKNKLAVKTSMNFLTALKLSFNNLKSKKVRTALTAIAGSIGIIGVALVLSISNGFGNYINDMQSTTLGNYPIQVFEQSVDMNALMNAQKEMMNGVNLPEFIDDKNVITYKEQNMMTAFHKNNITNEYIDYVNKIDKNLVNAITHTYGVDINMVGKKSNKYYKVANSDLNFQQLVGEKSFMETQYDIIDGKYPANANELVLVIDKYNRISEKVITALGLPISEKIDFSSILGTEYKVVSNDDYYYKDNQNIFRASNNFAGMYNAAESTSVKIVGIMRVKKNDNSALISSIMSSGLAYTNDLVKEVYNGAKNSEVVKAQIASPTIDVTSGLEFKEDVTMTKADQFKAKLQKLGGDETPVGINIYPINFEAKDGIINYLNKFNEGKVVADQIRYMDMAEMATSTMSTLVDTITIVLVAFACISLVVSSLMIGIITYVSVVERTKEIGILRSVGARKKDVSHVFTAETFIIGLIAGVFGIVVTLLLTIPINLIINSLVGISGISSLSFGAAIILICVSTLIAVVAGIIPSKIASKKDPVVALRTE